jgi:hypothetical protein
MVDGSLMPVAWRQLLPNHDLRDRSWFDVAGVRLHVGRSASAWDVEPAVGPLNHSVVRRTVQHLVTDDVESVGVAQWSGYGRTAPWDESDGFVLSVNGNSYHARMLLGADLRQLVAGDTERSVYPNLIWDSSGSWIYNSDMDLPCTLVGCDESRAQALRNDPELESLQVDVNDLIIA